MRIQAVEPSPQFIEFRSICGFESDVVVLTYYRSFASFGKTLVPINLCLVSWEGLFLVEKEDFPEVSLQLVILSLHGHPQKTSRRRGDFFEIGNCGPSDHVFTYFLLSHVN